MESIRCLLYFVFDLLIFSSWILSAPPKYQLLFQLVFIFLRIVHIGSIIFWISIWLKGLIWPSYKEYQNCNLVQEHNADLNKNHLKDTEKNNIKSNSHENRRWKKYQKFIIFITVLFSVLILFGAFSLQLKECDPLVNFLKDILKFIIHYIGFEFIIQI